VAEDYRRQNIAMKLIFTAGYWGQYRGWSGRIHIGGKRTDLGQRMVEAFGDTPRVAPWTERSMMIRNAD
jgi:hypothetical protein